MRYETLNAGSYLVWRLHHAPTVQQVQDDGDLISVRLKTSEEALLYLVERPLPLSEIIYHYQVNTARGQHTLFFFQVALLLPEHGTIYQPDDWMSALLNVQRQQIYAYEGAGRHAFFFPVHFEPRADGRTTVKYGDVIDYAALRCETSTAAGMAGTWRTAAFAPAGRRHWSRHYAPADPTPLADYYAILGVAPDAALPAIKQAYRALARQYHPDRNHSREAHLRMKLLNEAYHRLLAHLTPP